MQFGENFLFLYQIHIHLYLDSVWISSDFKEQIRMRSVYVIFLFYYVLIYSFCLLSPLSVSLFHFYLKSFYYILFFVFMCVWGHISAYDSIHVEVREKLVKASSLPLYMVLGLKFRSSALVASTLTHWSFLLVPCFLPDCGYLFIPSLSVEKTIIYLPDCSSTLSITHLLHSKDPLLSSRCLLVAMSAHLIDSSSLDCMLTYQWSLGQQNGSVCKGICHQTSWSGSNISDLYNRIREAIPKTDIWLPHMYHDIYTRACACTCTWMHTHTHYSCQMYNQKIKFHYIS